VYILLFNSCVKFHSNSACTAEISTKVEGIVFLTVHCVSKNVPHYCNDNFIKS